MGRLCESLTELSACHSSIVLFHDDNLITRSVDFH